MVTEHTEEARQMGESDDSEEEDKEENRSLRLTDEQLFQLCEGRTAHK